jgi:hypothetical protein
MKMPVFYVQPTMKLTIKGDCFVPRNAIRMVGWKESSFSIRYKLNIMHLKENPVAPTHPTTFVGHASSVTVTHAQHA